MINFSNMQPQPTMSPDGKPKKSIKSVVFLIIGIIVAFQIIGVTIAISAGEESADAIFPIISSAIVWIIIISVIASAFSKKKYQSPKAKKHKQTLLQGKKTMYQVENLLKGNQFAVIKSMLMSGKLDIIGKFIGQAKWQEVKRLMEQGQYQEVTRLINQKNVQAKKPTNYQRPAEPPKAAGSMPTMSSHQNAPGFGSDTARIVLLIAALLVMIGVGIYFVVEKGGF